jgi:hypothetical protein
VKEVAAGLSLGAVGVAFLIGALGLDIGTAHRMGPGYYPLLVAGAAIVVGLLNAVLVCPRHDDRTHEAIAWRPLIAVLASIAVFAATVQRLGLVPAVVAAVLLAAAGDRTARWPGALVLAVVAALGAWLIFRVGLALELPAFRQFG